MSPFSNFARFNCTFIRLGLFCLIPDIISGKLKKVLQAIRLSFRHSFIILRQVLASKKISASPKFVKGRGISCLFIILLIKDPNLLIDKFTCKYKQIR